MVKMISQLCFKPAQPDTALTVQQLPLPILIERAKGYLELTNAIFRHEDPEGPESGGLLAGAKQLTLALGQFM